MMAGGGGKATTVKGFTVMGKEAETALTWIKHGTTPVKLAESDTESEDEAGGKGKFEGYASRFRVKLKFEDGEAAAKAGQLLRQIPPRDVDVGEDGTVTTTTRAESPEQAKSAVVNYLREKGYTIEESMVEAQKFSAKDHYKSVMARHKNARPIDPDEYPPIKGMEGPFRFRDGRTLYYDPKEGKYYDSKTDMYVDNKHLPEEVELEEAEAQLLAALSR